MTRRHDAVSIPTQRERDAADKKARPGWTRARCIDDLERNAAMHERLVAMRAGLSARPEHAAVMDGYRGIAAEARELVGALAGREIPQPRRAFFVSVLERHIHFCETTDYGDDDCNAIFRDYAERDRMIVKILRAPPFCRHKDTCGGAHCREETACNN